MNTEKQCKPVDSIQTEGRILGRLAVIFGEKSLVKMALAGLGVGPGIATMVRTLFVDHHDR